MIYQTVLAAALVASASAGLFPEDPHQQKSLWESFKRNHGKKYETMDEETKRFSHFLENLKMADLRNAAELKNGGNAVHGITHLLDLSQAEFESRFLTADVTKKSKERVFATIERPVDTTMGAVDWSGRYTTPVKNQGYCGSCWAFSATEQIESDAMRTLGVTYTLSPEQITQCTPDSYGCNGGWTESAYRYVQNANGIVTEDTYPYTSYNGNTGSCQVDISRSVIKVTGYSTINGESSMASYVQSTGPLSVCLDASSWNSYYGGVMTNCGQSVDHCVQAVGVDTSAGYWKVRNSWGEGWGESGYIRLSYGQNICNIASDPTFTSVVRY